MKLSELSGEAVNLDPDITGLTADSRTVEKGFLFAALPGVIADGGRFVVQARQKGAAAVLASPGIETTLPIIHDENPRRRFSDMAAKFFERQPQVVAGITGTNGKTSTARFAAELWQFCGNASGSMGTLGAVGKDYNQRIGHTTPDPVTLHQTLDHMAQEGITHLAMEVSSHGLSQHRADGVRFSLAAFTNISHDHLDYHNTFEQYFHAKARLFDELISDDGTVVINADGAGAKDICAIAKRRNIKILLTGKSGDDFRILNVTPSSTGLKLKIKADGQHYDIQLPLIGKFQAENALLAAGLVVASGEDVSNVIPLLENLSAVPGRMQRVSTVTARDGEAGVYVDYAHTPDAVSTALQAIRPHTQGRVIVILGAGGDRDQAKRALMGVAAETYADIVIVTDDNPRNEDPALIRKKILEGCHGAKEIGDRAEAIRQGIAMLGAGDVLLIAGKGHETGQQIGGKTIPFSDQAVARAAARERNKELG